MTYRHKREKCAQETKEILKEVLKIKKEEYGCLDCAESVRVSNPMEKILAEEVPQAAVKSQTEAIMEEMDSPIEAPQTEGLETYVSTEEISEEESASSLESLKKN